MRILHLTLKKKWFDMVLSDEKKEEYREYKDYWLKRLSNFFGEFQTPVLKSEHNKNGYEYYKFDVIVFRHGYAKDAPTITIECCGISEGKCKPEWSDNAKGTHIILRLGKIISTNNIKTPPHE